MSAEPPESTVSPPEGSPSEGSPSDPSRRTFIATTTVVGGAVVAGGLMAGPSVFGAEDEAAETSPNSRVSLIVNGSRHTAEVDNRTSLLDLLREHLGITAVIRALPTHVRMCRQGPRRRASYGSE